MANKITLELAPNIITALVEKLSIQDKMKLVQKLERETLGLRWKRILKDIDSRLKRFPISREEVNKEIQAYRKEKYA